MTELLPLYEASPESDQDRGETYSIPASPEVQAYETQQQSTMAQAVDQVFAEAREAESRPSSVELAHYVDSVGVNLAELRVRAQTPPADAKKGSSFFRRKERPLHQLSERELIQRESEYGRTLFGPLQKGDRREFFCLEPNVWYWHEEARGPRGAKSQRTTRYEVHDDRVIKTQDGEKKVYLEGRELYNLAQSTRFYYDLVVRNVYRHDPLTGRPLD